MNWYEIRVETYYRLLIEIGKTRKFEENFIGLSPFYPSNDEVKVIELLREEEFKRRVQAFQNNLSVSLDDIELIESYLNTEFEYRFQRQYTEKTMFPLSVGSGDLERLERIDDLSNDLAMWDFGRYLVGELQQRKHLNIGSKLMWKCKPAVMGHIISEWIRLEYIDAPLKADGEINYKELARILSTAFSGLGSIDNLRQNLSPDNSKALSDSNKKRFHFPDKRELG